jgi:hypothetical protein
MLGVLAAAAGHNRSKTMSTYDKVRAFMKSKFGHTDGEQPAAGAGSHRSGGFQDFHDYDGLGVFKGGVSVLAGRGNHSLSKTMNERGSGEVGNDSSPPHGEVEMSQGSNDSPNRAHIKRGRELAQSTTRRGGATHPMQHAKSAGKGRW